MSCARATLLGIFVVAAEFTFASRALAQAPLIPKDEPHCEPGLVAFRGNCLERRRLVWPHDERCDPPCAGSDV